MYIFLFLKVYKKKILDTNILSIPFNEIYMSQSAIS